MRIDARLEPESLAEVPALVRRLEALGYDGAFTAESRHDALLPLALAFEHSERLRLGPGVTVAPARNPVQLAHAAHDLQQMSQGRLVLGLGSQVRAHAELRLGVPWDHPIDRMREFVGALRSIWDCWERGSPLVFRGRFHRHMLMPPFFRPEPHGLGDPPVLLAAVGPRMTALAGEIADGVYLHDFSTRAYVDDVTLPALERGLAAKGRVRSKVEVTCPVIVVTGRNAEQWDRSAARARKTIAFHASTPSYRAVLAVHGWERLGDELSDLARRGRWEVMADLIDDDILSSVAVVAEPDAVADELLRRYGDYADRLRLTVPPGMSEADEARLVGMLQSAKLMTDIL